jgi:hypothetical protein
VHATNVLRALFRNSTLSLDVQPYVERGLLICMAGLGATRFARTWPASALR